MISRVVIACKSSGVKMAKFQPVDGTLIPGFNPDL